MKTFRLTIALAVVLLIGAAGPASADPAGPTDFQNEVLWTTPAVDGFEVALLGGDSFIELRVSLGTSVVVYGYRGEEYIRVSDDGLVEENQHSPSKYLNEERYGGAEAPDFATPDAQPDWKVVAQDGSWAWHDHRTHLMGTGAPPGTQRGDQVNEGVVLLLVDGIDVKVSVATFWLPAPSPALPILGGCIGLALLALCLRRLTSAPVRSVVLGMGLAAAALLGIWQLLSLPAEAAPSVASWTLPLQGLVALAAGLWQRSQATNVLGHQIALVLELGAALQLAFWAMFRWGSMVSAVLPTNAPAPLERFGAALALVVGVGVSAIVLSALIMPKFAKQTG